MGLARPSGALVSQRQRAPSARRRCAKPLKNVERPRLRGRRWGRRATEGGSRWDDPPLIDRPVLPFGSFNSHPSEQALAGEPVFGFVSPASWFDAPECFRRRQLPAFAFGGTRGSALRPHPRLPFGSGPRAFDSGSPWLPFVSGPRAFDSCSPDSPSSPARGPSTPVCRLPFVSGPKAFDVCLPAHFDRRPEGPWSPFVR